MWICACIDFDFATGERDCLVCVSTISFPCVSLWVCDERVSERCSSHLTGCWDIAVCGTPPRLFRTTICYQAGDDGGAFCGDF